MRRNLRTLRNRAPWVVLTAAAVVALQGPGSGTSALAGPAPAASACIASGTEAAINAALVGAGAQAVLCPGAVFTLNNSVTFTAANQAILTQGLPTDGTRAILKVAGSSLTTAIAANNQSGVTVENIQVDGSRPTLGALTGGALLEMGGNASGQVVQNITAHDTRSWSDLHIIEGTVTNNTPTCQNTKILDNLVGPSGTATPSATGVWADGISLACGNSLVQGNTVQDATDGGIVVFGAPGSTIQDNTIVAKSQLLLGGINMVDYAPMNGNFTGTLVTHNTIDAQGAFIKVGLGMGQQVWNCTTGTLYGATVTDNTLQGQYMGYGYAVNGVQNWTVTGNVDNSRHVGSQTAGGCFGSPAASQPAGFQVEKQTSSTLQADFTSAVLTNVLSITSPPITGGPTLGASPASLAFGTVDVGATSGAQTVSIQNNGTAAVTGVSVAVSGDFAQTNTCGTSIAAGATCTASVSFHPTAGGARSGSLSVSSSAANSPTTVALSGTGVTSSTNLALGKPITASSYVQNYVPANANDGNTSTYWESANNAFPQWIQVDLGAGTSIGSTVLNLPPSTSWAARTQTIAVSGSNDGTTFASLVAPTAYTFDPAANNNTVTIPVTASTRYLRLTFSGNSGWPAGQLSEFQVFGSGGTTPTATLTASPASVSFGSQTVGSAGAAQTVTVRNTGTAAATIGSVAVSGDYAQTNTCGSSLAAGASCTASVTFTPTASGSRTGSLTVTSSATNSPTVVALSGTGTSSNPNLALNAPVTAGSYTQNYVPANAVDGNPSTYWESANNAFPQWIQVDLGASHTVGRIVLNLPPDTAWATRTQTLVVQGSADGATYTTLAGSTGYTFNPATGNTVTITVTGSARYVKLTFSANTGWPAAQLSEFAVYQQ